MHIESIQPGQIVDVIAPASACTRQELNKAVKAIEQLGLKPRVPKDLIVKMPLFSNTDARRWVHLQRALTAPDSNLIWCLRGGYGAIRLMPQLRELKKPVRPKILLGYSDISSLHLHLNQHWRWPSLHGPVLASLSRVRGYSADLQELFDVLSGYQGQVRFENLHPLNAAARRKGLVEARTIGGNMTVLQSSLGTPSALKPAGHFLFFEDLNERPHRVDRMLTQFAQAGWFDKCRAVVLGEFILTKARDRRELWEDVFKRFANSVDIPVVSGLPVGHGARNRVLPLGTLSHLRLGSTVSLSLASGIAQT